MKRSVLIYWTLVAGAGVLAGVIIKQLDKQSAIRDNVHDRNALRLNRTDTGAIECSKDMNKAALLTHFPDSNTRGFSLPRRPHN
ncbi:hypothetical protein [Flavihumibacter solisilvae]|uniref:Uncharacterized protein n=1 Tax=Flavihumibacter solisilvae TaxID=1349421 RepID=A0A0C1LM80_9BACT|nr:hypothetical protein [Flavihumibacter solisilvae]KIC96443.1 hypothetical protein OI18_01525 [Flavihumibacter solisilvae]